MPNIFSRRGSLPLFVLLLFAVIGLYGISNFISIRGGNFGSMSGGDGAYYVLRLKTIMNGDSVASCPFDPRWKTEGTFIPSLIERAWASIISRFTQDTRTALVVTYLALPAVLYAALVYFLYLGTGNILLSIVFGFWGVVDRSTFFWKPFVGIAPGDEPLAYFRYANPMLFQIPFVAAFGTYFAFFPQIHAVSSHKKLPKATKWGFFVVLALGMLVQQVQPYYWIYLVLTLAFFVGISVGKGRWFEAGVASLITLGLGVLGLPEVVRLAVFMANEDVMDVLHRIGCVIENHRTYFLFHMGFWSTFGAYQYVCRKHRDQKWAFLTASMLAGYVCLNQTLVTGLSSHDHHYFRPMMVAYVFVMADLANRLLRMKPPLFRNPTHKFVVAGFFCLLVVLRGSLGVRLHLEHENYGSSAPVNWTGIQKTIDRLKEIPSQGNNLILADPQLTYVIDIVSDHYSYIHEYFYHCIQPDEMLFKRWAFLGRARGWSAEQQDKMLKHFVLISELPYWLYGLPESYAGRKDRYLPHDLQDRIKGWVDAYRRLDLGQLAHEQIKLGEAPQYALKSPGFDLDLAGLSKYFHTHLVFAVPEEGTELWTLTPRKQNKDHPAVPTSL